MAKDQPKVQKATVMRVEEIGEFYVSFYLAYLYEQTQYTPDSILKIPDFDVERWDVLKTGQTLKDTHRSRNYHLYWARSLEEALKIANMASEGQTLFLEEIPVNCENLGVANRNVNFNINDRTRLYKPTVRALAMVDRRRAKQRYQHHQDFNLLNREMNYSQQFIFRIDNLKSEAP